MIFTIKMHSVADLITNSSTVIFTYSEGSVGAFYELADEILKLSGETKSAKEIFIADVLMEYDEKYDEYAERYNIELPQDFSELLCNLKAGKAQKLPWMNDAEEYFSNNYDDYWRPGTQLIITVKDPKYEDLAKKVIKFLYSTEQDGGRDG